MSVQLIIPMSGLGQRFVNQGYSDLKPLINVHGKPMIAWVLRMFPKANSPIFICRNDHLKNTKMRQILDKYCHDGKVIGIDGAKLGPVGALISAFESINDDDPVIVSYCDYYMKWEYLTFLRFVEDKNYDGAIPCYTGFHPNLLPENNLYASCRINGTGELLEIREKFSFNSDKTKSLLSAIEQKLNKLLDKENARRRQVPMANSSVQANSTAPSAPSASVSSSFVLPPLKNTVSLMKLFTCKFNICKIYLLI